MNIPQSEVATPVQKGLTQSLARFGSSLAFADIPKVGVETARMGILDCIGCTLAGASADAARAVAAMVLHDGGVGEAVLIGLGGRAPAGAAALVNGTAAHSYDFDDTNPPMIGHPSVPIVPALLALADRFGATGQEFIVAYVVGFDVEARLGRFMNPPHYAHGWHATSTLGSLAAAAAAAKLMRLDAQGFSRAIGIAASCAGGLRENFGTMVKPLHAGLAARAGVVSALLADNGLTAAPEILEADRGFMRVFGGDGRTADAAGLSFGAGQALEIVTSGIGIKRYACCGCTHTALDALLELRQEHDFDHHAVERIECGVNSLAPDVLIHHTADTPLQAKFSMEYALGVGLVDGAAGLEQFTSDRVRDPQVQAALRKVHMYIDAECPVRQGVFPSKVSVHLRDGRSLSCRVDEAKGHPNRPLSEAELSAKFMACAHGGLDRTSSAKALQLLLRLEELEDVREVTNSLVSKAGR